MEELTLGDGYRLKLEDQEKRTALLYLEPFVLDIFHDGVRVLSVNRNGYLNVEPIRRKGSPLEDASQYHDPRLFQGLWEESFGSHTDQKPRGKDYHWFLLIIGR